MPATKSPSRARTSGKARRSSPRRSAKGRRNGRTRRPSSVRSAVNHLSPRWLDVIGIALLVLAALAALALWVDAGGLFGRLLEVGVKGAFGPVGHAVPVALSYWAILLIRSTSREDRGRILVGLAILSFGVLGIASVVRGNPSPASGYEPLSDAGGALGAVVAWPLSRAVSDYGAVVVCLGLAALGVLIFTATPLAAVGRSLRQLLTRPDEADLDVASVAPADVPQDGVVASPEREEIAAPAGPMPLPEPEGTATASKRPQPSRNGYTLPPANLLRRAPATAGDSRDAEHTKAALETTFRNFGVAARVTDSHRGPTVTMYEVEVAAGTKVNRVLSLADDIAYALATPDVRIIAPIPGRSAIGVEVPNRVRDFVMLGDVLTSKAAREVTGPLFVGLGKDVHGRAVLVNLAEMPHVLIAGATGAGKSSLINTFVTSILMRTTPDDVKLVLVDPKRVELSHFADLPHLISPVIVHPKRAAEALGWVVREMEMRYEAFATVGMRDIEAYNAAHDAGTLRVPPGREDEFGRVPFILVVIDELADLMMVAPRDVEDAICRIAQMARAVGIHLVVATQRPSVDVVTGLIKANIPSRIAFMTASQADSRVILDVGGAEKLVGHGDMLFQPANVSKAVRIQGAWVTEKEIEAIAGWCRDQQQPEFVANVEGLGRPPTEDEGLEGGDELLEQAAELVIRSQLGSTSMLQRKLKVGFARAGRLMDLLEERGIVGPSQGSKARDVLMTLEEWQEAHPRTP
ncbi:MAG: DNA translocase FtsK [Actinomycetota bacterium]|nr:DNA translocase FtsK [Actinomycetota bacterium]